MAADRFTTTDDTTTYTGASAIGIVAGMRTFTAPAAVGQFARTAGSHRHRFGAFAHPAVANTLLVLAAAELIADKLPFTPKRTAPAGLIGRLISGAVCGAALCHARDRSPVVGAIAGIFGALGSTYAGYELRHEATASFGLPDPVVALAEDAAAVWICTAIGASIQRGADSTASDKL